MKFRLIDRINEYEPEKWITGSKTVSFEEYSLRSRISAEPSLPETLIVESLFQLGNWLVMASTDFAKMGVIVRTERIEFLNPAGPGQRMEGRLSVRSWRESGILFDGEIRIGGNIAAHGTGCLATPAALCEFHNPDDMRTLFGEIYRGKNTK